MKNAELESVYKSYGDLFSEEPQYTINFVKDHSAVLTDSPDFDDASDFKKYLAILSRYIKSLVDLGRYNLAIDEASKYLPLIEKARTAFFMKETDDSWYLTLRFQKAMAYFKLKDYKVALKEFKELQKIDPQSDHLKQWTEYARLGQFKKYEVPVTIIAFALILGSRLLRSHIPALLGFILVITGLFLAVFYLWIDYKIKRSNRKK